MKCDCTDGSFRFSLGFMCYCNQAVAFFGNLNKKLYRSHGLSEAKLKTCLPVVCLVLD